MECIIRYKTINLGYGKGRAPLLLQNIKTNAPIAIDIGVKDLRPECNLYKPSKEDKKLKVRKVWNRYGIAKVSFQISKLI